MQIRPGSMYPLGASYDGAGVNFALYSQVAQKVELCLFDEDDAETRVEMTEQNGGRHQRFILTTAELIRARVINALKVK